MTIPKDLWEWMPHPGHLCVGEYCRFHLTTYIGGFLVSTVGEYVPDSVLRETMAKSRGITLEGMGDARERDYLKKLGYREIGLGRIYETMVFEAIPGDSCCPWVQKNGHDLETAGYNDAIAAYQGHLAMCDQVARGEVGL